MKRDFEHKANGLKPLPGKTRLEGTIEYREVDPDGDFETAYRIFKEAISPTVMAMNDGVWPEEERKPFFKKGFSDDGMYMLLHNGKRIGCFCITELNLPFVTEQELDLNDESAAREFSQRPTYKAAILQRMYIDPAYQSQGIGKVLMAMALEHAHNLQLPLELEVLSNNEATIGGYKKYGYKAYSKIMSKGWNIKYLMRHSDTEQYMPAAPHSDPSNDNKPKP